jgi:hypothetical protein
MTQRDSGLLDHYHRDHSENYTEMKSFGLIMIVPMLSILIVLALIRSDPAKSEQLQGNGDKNAYDGRGRCLDLQSDIEFARDVQRGLTRDLMQVEHGSQQHATLSNRLEEARYALSIAQENYDLGGCSRGGRTVYEHRYRYDR